MQDARKDCRNQVLSLFIFLALALGSLPTYAADTASSPLLCDSASCLLLPDATSDGGQEGGLSHGDHSRHFKLPPKATLSEIQGFRGPVHCASFPVLPQAPPSA
jgi:hypothetical protein